jgi:hypothetical protein
MRDEKVIAVCEKYEKNLKESYLLDKDLQHIKWMLMRIPKFIKENQQEKANR